MYMYGRDIGNLTVYKRTPVDIDTSKFNMEKLWSIEVNILFTVTESRLFKNYNDLGCKRQILVCRSSNCAGPKIFRFSV